MSNEQKNLAPGTTVVALAGSVINEDSLVSVSGRDASGSRYRVILPWGVSVTMSRGELVEPQDYSGPLIITDAALENQWHACGEYAVLSADRLP